MSFLIAILALLRCGYGPKHNIPDSPRLAALAPGLSPRSVLEKFAALQLIDIEIPTTDGREIQLTRHTEPQAELKLLLNKLKLELPAQPPREPPPFKPPRHPHVVPTFGVPPK
jgi:hypothetical protein